MACYGETVPTVDQRIDIPSDKHIKRTVGFFEPTECDEDVTRSKIDKERERRSTSIATTEAADRRDIGRIHRLREDLANYSPMKMGEEARQYGKSSIEPVTITFIGPKSSGKTAIIHTIERAFYNTTGLTDAIPGVPTKHVTYHLTTTNYIRLVDTPGIDFTNPHQATNILKSLVSGDVEEGEAIDPDKHGRDQDGEDLLPFSKISRPALIIVFVVRLSDVLDPARRRELLDQYNDLRIYLQNTGYISTMVVTMGERDGLGQLTKADVARKAGGIGRVSDDSDLIALIKPYHPYSFVDDVKYPLERRLESEEDSLKFLKACLPPAEGILVHRMHGAQRLVVAATEVNPDASHRIAQIEHQEGSTDLRTFLFQQDRRCQLRLQPSVIHEVAEAFAKIDIFNFAGLRCCRFDEKVRRLLDGDGKLTDTDRKMHPRIQQVIKSGCDE